MRKLLGIVILFFSLWFSVLLGSNANQAEAIQATGCIQSITKETVVLVSNNISDSKTATYKSKNNKNFSNLPPLILSYSATNCLRGEDRIEYSDCFIQNRKTEKQKIHQIRAP